MKTTTVKNGAKNRAVPTVPDAAPAPEVPAVASSEDPPVGSVRKARPKDLVVLRALNDSMIKAKAQAFDQLMGMLTQTGKTLEPIDQEFRSQVHAAAKAAKCPFDGEMEWTFVLEDGSFKRTK